MYENYRDNSGRRPYRSEDSDRREASWRDPSWPNEQVRRQDRDDDWHAERAGFRPRGEYGDHRSERLHDDDHGERRYRSSADYQDDNRRADFFNAEQNSWAVPPVRTYGGHGMSSGYGRDYMDRGYGDRGVDRHERGFFAKAGDEVASWFGDEEAARRREADHRGRGPKDYVRSDDRIRDDVNDRLTEDWHVDASNITTTVDKGEVTLDGTVTERAAKRRAEDIVEDISGVKHVQNNLRVAQQPSIGAQDQNWTLDRRPTAEGGTLGSDATSAKH